MDGDDDREGWGEGTRPTTCAGHSSACANWKAPSRFDLGGAPDLARRDVLPPRSVSQPQQRQRIPRRCGAGDDGGSGSWIPGLVLRIRWGAFSGRSGRLRCAARLTCHATLCPVHASRKTRALVACLRGLRNNRRRSHRSFGRRCRLRPMRGRAGSGGRSGTRSAVNACRFHRTSVPLRFRYTRYIRPALTLGCTWGTAPAGVNEPLNERLETTAPSSLKTPGGACCVILCPTHAPGAGVVRAFGLDCALSLADLSDLTEIKSP